MLRNARLYAHTLPHLTCWQMAGRIVARVRAMAGLVRLPVPPESFRARSRPHVPFPEHEPWNRREDILQGRFCFLNQAADLGRPVDWRAQSMPLLWRFNLHYFHYLHLLARNEQEGLCRSWVHANPPGTAVSWHAYPTSLRIVNWCRANLQADDLQESLYLQAAHLYRNLETYVYGNHLLENARALVYAGVFFGDTGEAPRWLERGLQLYRKETPIQVLSDGGHYERSPMYHALMLEGYLDVLNLLPDGHPDRPWLEETVQRMVGALVSMTHPDGNLALLNDATQEIALAPDDLLDYVHRLTGYRARKRSILPETGYFIHEHDDLYLIIDGGPAGPDHLLAHAHADVFSYELSLGGLPFVVDSGVYEYQAGPMRQYVRGTGAHNTVCVDGVDQIECWGSFRVARRSAPHDVSFSIEEGRSRFEGTYSGYARLVGDGITHRRRIDVDERQREIIVTDQVTGAGRHRVESRIHFHPEVSIEEGEHIVIRRESVSCQLHIDSGTLRWEDGWYCPRFGVRHRNRVAVIESNGKLPKRLAYRFHY